MTTGYMYEEGMKVLEAAMDKEDWVEKVQVVLETEDVRGTYGPNLESVGLDLEGKRLVVEDYFTEVTIILGEMVYVDYDEVLDVWTYGWDNGVSVHLYVN